MKKSTISFTLFLCLMGSISCDKYDDTDLRTQIQSLEQRVESIEKQITVFNTNINSINTIVTTLEKNLFITSVKTTNNGYTLIFSDQSQVTITNGKDGVNGTNGIDAPIINVRLNDGVYYWVQTYNGITSWLKDSDGNMIPVSGTTGVTPLLKVDSENYWLVSYNDGLTYSRVLDSNKNPIKAKADGNESYFKSIEILNNELLIVLIDGTELSLPINAISPYKAIDLGLSVKWSSNNFNANNAHEVGGLYLWGDVDNSGIIGFYTAPNLNKISGTNYDIVKKTLSGSWRLPTKKEQEELVLSCKWTRTTLNGVLGMKVEGPNGKSIFLPATGYALPKSGPLGSSQIIDPTGGYYWVDETHVISNSSFAYYFYFNNTSYYYNASFNTSSVKNAIRPVKG